jgi:flavin-dependent dehydrogenase
LGAVVDGDDDIPDAAIVMAIGRSGYVGRARLGDGRICLAAAVDSVAVRRHAPWGVIREILVECGASARIAAANGEIHGTGPLTRRPRSAAAERLFLLGDACGYVEPFTGQGMAVALETATAVSPFVEAALTKWNSAMVASWNHTVAAISGNRNRFCRGLAFTSRRPWLTDAALASIARAPTVIAALIARMNRLPTTLRA